jgi:predicted nucleic acid-binding protein
VKRRDEMRVLLDTNILIHREAATVVRRDIGKLFNWLDKLKCTKCVHPASREEIAKHNDPKVRRTFEAKLDSYHLLKTLAPPSAEIIKFATDDKTENNKIDTLVISELYAKRVDFLISEDRGVHKKAAELGIADRAFTIDAFLEKCQAENPELVDYNILAVKKVLFGQVNVKSEFFNSFREDYGGDAFDQWFNRKADEPVYVCYEGSEVVAFLYVKVEGHEEGYADINPVFKPKRRLKIGTFKVELNGYRLGERFLKIVLDNAIRQNVEEVYITIFPRTLEQEALIRTLEEFGFSEHGIKTSKNGNEAVYVRDMTPNFDMNNPKRTLPYISRSSNAYIVSIYPKYHTTLFPDSILKTESPDDYVEQQPHMNAIRKIYISRSIFRDLHRGDIIAFYRTGGYYLRVATTLGIVDGIYRNIPDEEQFVALCRKRSVFTDEELREHWNYRKGDRPFIVGFLYAYSFPKRPNLKELIDNEIIRDIESVPRGFEKITTQQFSRLLAISKTDMRIAVD